MGKKSRSKKERRELGGARDPRSTHGTEAWAFAASDRLTSAINEVASEIGRPIKISNISSHPNPATRIARGHHDWDGQVERIWLNPNLSHNDQEAVAAHELAHVLQRAEGYCQTATLKDRSGQSLFPLLTLLGTTINSTVMDVMADQWAANRGFKVQEGLRSDALPKALADIKRTNTAEPESVDWNAYYARLAELQRLVRSGTQINSPVAIPNPEIKTQILAVGYAGLQRRLSPHGLFSELDQFWNGLRPEARALGIEIAKIVSQTGTESRAQCESSVIGVIQYLKIPPGLICVKRAMTDEITWP
jgi:hypothetical protein